MEDKAVIQPGPSDIPTVRVQLEQLMNSARVPGGKSALFSSPQAPIVHFLVFLQMFRCAQSTEKPETKTIGQGKPEAGKPRAGTLGPHTPSLALPTSPCHVLDSGSSGWSLPGQGCLESIRLGLFRKLSMESSSDWLA